MQNKLKYLNTTFRFYLIISLVLQVFLLTSLARPVYAQLAGVSASYQVDDKDAVDGDILVSGDQGLIRSTTIASKRMFGVLQTESVVSFKTSGTNQQSVVTSGTGQVNVTNINGSIKKGDFVTSSTTPGKGAKLLDSGYTIGVAMEDFDGQATGKIMVAIKIDYSEITNAKSVNRFLSSLNNTFLNGLQTTDQFPDVVRYAAAGLVIFLSLMFGFITFSRSVPKGVEAIGRNPLAKNMIYVSMLINILFTVITTAIGIGAAVLILKL